MISNISITLLMLASNLPFEFVTKLLHKFATKSETFLRI